LPPGKRFGGAFVHDLDREPSHMRLTVAICTWNRAKLLDQTLVQMRELRIPEGVDWELLVVNNNCTDDTDAVIARHSDKLPLRRLHEPKPGLSNARNCAVAATKGDLLIWTDDDVLVDKEWLAAYAKAAADWPAAYFGGPVDPWFAASPPAWIERNLDQLANPFAIRQYGDEHRLFQDGEYPVGANMAFRTTVLREYSFDSRLGREGANLIGGEEYEVFQRLMQAGLRGVWVGSARVRHYIPSDRLTRRYLESWHRGVGRTLVRRNCRTDGRHWWSVPRWVYRRYLTALVKSWLYFSFAERQWLTNCLTAAHARGMIDEYRSAG
jgi:glucosyl-dolichyl phosphate glucuronosyltransferase